MKKLILISALYNTICANDTFIYDEDEFAQVVCNYNIIYNNTKQLTNTDYNSFKNNFFNQHFEIVINEMNNNHNAYDSIYNLGYSNEKIDSLDWVRISKCSVKSNNKLSIKDSIAVNIFNQISNCYVKCKE